MADKPPQLFQPTDIPPSPPYANNYLVHKDGEVVTLLFMRIPPAYTDARLQEILAMKQVPAPVVSSVTLTLEGAKTFVALLESLLKQGKEESS